MLKGIGLAERSLQLVMKSAC